LINNDLREYIKHQQEPIEVILRRVVREELQSAAQNAMSLRGSVLRD
jgi:hypothetical protein